MRKPVWQTSEQGSADWLKARCGNLTASRMADAIAFLKGGKETEARRKYKIELVAERMTDLMVSRYVNDAMQWGIEQEAPAKSRYEEVTGSFITPCGFAIHGEIFGFGASPDGLVDDDGLVEIKCPTTPTYVEWITAGVVPPQHHAQLLAQLAVTGRRYVDFLAYDPRIKVYEHQHFLRRFEPPEADIAAIEEAARKFLAEVEELFESVTSKEVA